jgi:hypothetical protein
MDNIDDHLDSNNNYKEKKALYKSLRKFPNSVPNILQIITIKSPKGAQ